MRWAIRVLLLLLACGCANVMRAGYTDVSLLRAPPGESAGAVMLLKESEYRFETDRGWYAEQREHRVIEIRDASGLSWAKTRISWRGQTQLRELVARTVHADGTAEEVESEQLIHDGSGDEHVVSFQFPGVRVGDRLEYAYVLLSPDFPTAIRAVITERIPVARYRAVLRGGPSLRVAFAAYTDKREVHRDIRGNWRVALERRNLPAQADEPFAGHWSLREPWWLLHLTHYVRSDGKVFTWHHGVKDEITGWVRLLQVDGEHRKGFRLAIDPDCADVACRIERAVSLTRRTARFTGWGSLQDARALAEVAREGRASSFEKALLLWHLLEEAGVEVRPAAVTRRASALFDPAFPSGQFLNHLVLYVPLQDRVPQPLWIDPSCESCRVGQLSSALVDTLAIVFAGGAQPGGDIYASAGIHRVVGAAPPANREARTWVLAVSSDGTVDVRLSFDAEGESATWFRAQTDGWGEKAWADWAEGWSRKRMPTAASVEFDALHCEENGGRCRAEVRYRLPAFAVASGDRTIVPLSFLPPSWGELFAGDGRRNPIVFGSEQETVDEVRLRVPEGWTVESFPQPASASVDPITAHVATALQEGAIVLTRRIRPNAGSWPRAEYEAIRETVGTFSALQQGAVVLRRR